jgi:hypothetical protein
MKVVKGHVVGKASKAIKRQRVRIERDRGSRAGIHGRGDEGNGFRRDADLQKEISRYRHAPPEKPASNAR